MQTAKNTCFFVSMLRIIFLNILVLNLRKPDANKVLQCIHAATARNIIIYGTPFDEQTSEEIEEYVQHADKLCEAISQGNVNKLLLQVRESSFCV